MATPIAFASCVAAPRETPAASRAIVIAPGDGRDGSSAIGITKSSVPVGNSKFRESTPTTVRTGSFGAAGSTVPTAEVLSGEPDFDAAVAAADWSE